MIKFDPASPHAMLYWVANNASDDPEWKNTPEWQAVQNWRIQTRYGMFVRAIDHVPEVFEYITNPDAPLKHLTNDALKRLEYWYVNYVLPIKQEDD